MYRLPKLSFYKENLICKIYDMKTIAFLGDSITHGTGLCDKGKRYSTILAERLGMVEENYGIPGTLMARAGLSLSDGTDFVSRMGLIDSADVAVIFGGTNDYFWSDTPISGGDGDEYFDRALEHICSHVRQTREGKITLFVTPYPHNGVGNFLGGEKWKSSCRHDTDGVNFNGHLLSDYASVIKKTCEKHALPCLDLHMEFDFDWEKHTSDGCHPNEEGHRLLADAIEAELSMLLSKNR